MLLDELKQIVGPTAWSEDPQVLHEHLTEWRGRVQGQTAIMLSPDSPQQVSDIVRACAAAGVALVPQGGNTGMCAAAVPDASGEQLLLSLSRLNRIRSVDADDFSIVVDAGCTLAAVQQAAAEKRRLFALSLSSEGSCQIGGNIATDAGGINVVRYGTMRSQVLGLEVVLADGRIWNGLRSLRKNTAGYDMKQLFIGSEGTLGIITGASLKLFPEAAESSVALLAHESAEQAIVLLSRLRERLGDCLQAFELMDARSLRWVERHIPDSKLPFGDSHPWYVLIDAATGPSSGAFEQQIMSAMEAAIVSDAVIAKNTWEAEALWRLRHSIAPAEQHEGAALKHDIAVPIARIGEFLRQGEALLAKNWPQLRLVAFGHVGDGNLHYNVVQPTGSDGQAFLGLADTISAAVYELALQLGGTISAEHGIGVLKRPWMLKYCDPIELDMMRAMKRALDPDNRLNPGKVL